MRVRGHRRASNKCPTLQGFQTFNLASRRLFTGRCVIQRIPVAQEGDLKEPNAAAIVYVRHMMVGSAARHETGSALCSRLMSPWKTISRGQHRRFSPSGSCWRRVAIAHSPVGDCLVHPRLDLLPPTTVLLTNSQRTAKSTALQWVERIRGRCLVEIQQVLIDELKPWDKNPRVNDSAVDAVTRAFTHLVSTSPSFMTST